jgi:hypothetical protein
MNYWRQKETTGIPWVEARRTLPGFFRLSAAPVQSISKKDGMDY